MLIFLDAADAQIIEKCLSTGIVDGITTNPTLLAKQKRNPLDLIKEILHIFPQGIINIEITELDVEKAYAQALQIRELGGNVVVKIPGDYRYLPLIHRLNIEKIPMNITLVFSVVQAVVMGKLGVRYVSPFVGRLYDHGIDGIETVRQIITCYKAYNFSTKILAASLRTIEQVNASVALGVDCITVDPALFQQLTKHELTDRGMAKFVSDWHDRNLFG
ncbi:MAG TPA: transaldolase family protein [Patescibacteria group bacterium]|nr:transaldolase family protein [Patescibacteria group bacterium]